MKISINKSQTAISLVILLLLILFWGDAKAVLQFSRSEIVAGEWWRLLSAHLVHLNHIHGALNAVVFILLAFLVGPYMTLVRWLVAGVFIGLFISLCLLVFSPKVSWYVGFSGVLHGFLLLGLGLGLRATRDKFMAAVLLLLLVKIAHEQLPGFDRDHLSHWIEGAVVVDAHLYGAIGGAILFFIFMLADFIFPFVRLRRKF